MAVHIHKYFKESRGFLIDTGTHMRLVYGVTALAFLELLFDSNSCDENCAKCRFRTRNSGCSLGLKGAVKDVSNYYVMPPRSGANVRISLWITKEQYEAIKDMGRGSFKSGYLWTICKFFGSIESETYSISHNTTPAGCRAYSLSLYRSETLWLIDKFGTNANNIARFLGDWLIANDGESL